MIALAFIGAMFVVPICIATIGAAVVCITLFWNEKEDENK